MSNNEKETVSIAHTVTVPGCVDLRFWGVILGSVEDDNCNEKIIWKVAIKSGVKMYVCVYYDDAGETYEKRVKICRNTQEIFDFLGYSGESKDLYNAADLDYYMYLGDLDDEMKEKAGAK